MSLTPVTQLEIDSLNNSLRINYVTSAEYYTRVQTALLDDVGAVALQTQVNNSQTLAEFVNLLTLAQLSYAQTELVRLTAGANAAQTTINLLVTDRDKYANAYHGLVQRIQTAIQYTI